MRLSLWPRRSLRCSPPMLGPDDRDRTRQPLKTPVMPARDEPQSFGRGRSARSDYRAQAPLPDANAMKQTCRDTSGFDRSMRDPERARRNPCADGSDAANPRPSAAPDPIRRGASNRPTAHTEPEGAPMG